MNTTTLFSFLPLLAYLSKGFIREFTCRNSFQNIWLFHNGSKRAGWSTCVTLYTGSQSCKRIAGTVRLNAWTYMYKDYKKYKKRKKRFKEKRVPFFSSVAARLGNWSTVTFKLLQGKRNNWPQHTQSSATMHLVSLWNVRCLCFLHLPKTFALLLHFLFKKIKDQCLEKGQVGRMVFITG